MPMVRARSGMIATFAIMFAALLSACSTSSRGDLPTVLTPVSEEVIQGYQPIAVGSGDILEIAFFERGENLSMPYRVRGGDILAINLLDHNDLTRDRVLVLPDGTISLAGIGVITAGGQTPAELADAISRGYAAIQLRNPRVAVSVVEADVRVNSLSRPTSSGPRTFQIVVDEDGYIDLPFISPVATGRPLLQLQEEIAAAYEQELDGRVEVTVNLRQRAPPKIYVLGDVGRPGAVDYKAPMTALMAVSSAGGFLNTANAEDVRLYRLTAEGRFAGQTIALRAGVNGRIAVETEVALRPSDILYIPKSGIAVSNLYVEQYIRNMLPTSVGFGLSYDVNR